MEQAMESPHALDGRNCRALVGKARFLYFTDVCHTYRCNEPAVRTRSKETLLLPHAPPRSSFSAHVISYFPALSEVPCLPYTAPALHCHVHAPALRCHVHVPNEATSPLGWGV